MVADGVSAGLVFLLASIARFGDGEWMEIWRGLGFDIRVVAVFFGVAWVAALSYQGMYQLRTRWRLYSEAVDIFRAAILVAALSLSALFIFKQNGVSRLVLGTVFIVEPIVTLASRAAMREGFARLRERGHNVHYMLMVGTGKFACDFADRVESRTGLGIRVVGHLAVPGATHGEPTRPVLGSIDDIGRVFRERVVDEVAVCLEPATVHLLDPLPLCPERSMGAATSWCSDRRVHRPSPAADDGTDQQPWVGASSHRE